MMEGSVFVTSGSGRLKNIPYGSYGFRSGCGSGSAPLSFTHVVAKSAAQLRMVLLSTILASGYFNTRYMANYKMELHP
jgi:hypothetical protein